MSAVGNVQVKDSSDMQLAALMHGLGVGASNPMVSLIVAELQVQNEQDKTNAASKKAFAELEKMLKAMMAEKAILENRVLALESAKKESDAAHAATVTALNNQNAVQATEITNLRASVVAWQGQHQSVLTAYNNMAAHAHNLSLGAALVAQSKRGGLRWG